MSRSSIFTTGGTVQAGNGLYLDRKVDEELFQLCLDGTFGFVLMARQLGKSSLIVRTAERLSEEGRQSAIIDLSQMGVNLTEEAWYLGFLLNVARRLRLSTDVFGWWKAHEHMSFSQRMTLFYQEILLDEIRDPVVIFVDEIDSTLSLPFTDDFFSSIRYVYNARSEITVFKRLTFVLIGVATPSDLISDPKRTPFNIGREVDVAYFTAEEALPLAGGFDLPEEQARQVLHWILAWTGGHPYLTQRLCAVVAEKEMENLDQSDVDKIVAATFFARHGEQDSNLRFVHDMLTRRAPDTNEVLTVYKKILLDRRILDNPQSLILSHLKLSGVVGRQNGRLVVRNRVYAKVFDPTWINNQWPEHWIKRIPPYAMGLVAALFVVVILLGLFLFQTWQAQQAQENSRIQEELNEQLSDQVQLSDSLRWVTEAVNLQLTDQISIAESLRTEAESFNNQLSNQVQVSDSLRKATETANSRLTEQVSVSDSLRSEAEGVNTELVIQIERADSLRSMAETQLEATRRARLETLTIALANNAIRRLRRGDNTVAALLARQAFELSVGGEGEYMDPVYDALRQTLNGLETENPRFRGGPEVVSFHSAGVRAVACDPDGRWFASADEDGTIGLWSTQTHSMRRLGQHSASTRSLSFSPVGELLASGGDDSMVYLWHSLEQQNVERETVGKHEGGVWSVVFSPDGKWLASAGADQTIVIWKVSGENRTVVQQTSLNGRIRTLAFSSDGHLLAAGCDDGNVLMWSWSDQRSRPVLWDTGQGRVLSLAFHPGRQILATGGDIPQINLWQVDNPGQVPALFSELLGHEGTVNDLCFDPDGRKLASGSSDGSVMIWNVENLDKSPILLHDHTSWVWSVAFDAQGSTLVSGSNDRTVRLWNIRPTQLADTICQVVEGRELTEEEWELYVGPDFSYDEFYLPCTNRTVAIE